MSLFTSHSQIQVLTSLQAVYETIQFIIITPTTLSNCRLLRRLHVVALEMEENSLSLDGGSEHHSHLNLQTIRVNNGLAV